MTTLLRHRITAGALAACSLVLYGFGASAQRPSASSIDLMSLRGPDPETLYEDIVIEQKLDVQVPLDLKFRNESGEPVLLGDFLGDRPAILSLGYFRCPMTCDAQLNALAVVMDAMKFKIGDDFDLISVSIDPLDTPESASAKKENYIAELRSEGGERGWHFLTTENEDTIDTLADTVGYRYVYDPVSEQYAHASGFMVLTPTGRIARYYYGLEYFPRDVEFGLVEASQGKIGDLVDRITVLCFRYDPTTGTYSLLIYRLVQFGGLLTIGGIALMYVLIYFRNRKRSGTSNVGGGDSTNTPAENLA